MTQEERNLDVVHAFFAAVRNYKVDPDAAATFYAEDVVQEEFPNQFLPGGATRNLEELKEAAARGRKVMAAQEYEIINAFAKGDTVVVESSWAGTSCLVCPRRQTQPMRAAVVEIESARPSRVIRSPLGAGLRRAPLR